MMPDVRGVARGAGKAPVKRTYLAPIWDCMGPQSPNGMGLRAYSSRLRRAGEVLL